MSDDLKLAHPEVAWREISGIRIILAHGYFHIDDDIIGNVVANDIPSLRSQLKLILDAIQCARTARGTLASWESVVEV